MERAALIPSDGDESSSNGRYQTIRSRRFVGEAKGRLRFRHLACARRPLRVCAVTRRRFPVGANPTRQPLQPEAIGAVMEATKWLKPSISVSRIGDTASVQAAAPG